MIRILFLISVMQGGLAIVSAQESLTAADQVIQDDLIVDGSLCVGFDCVDGESFGFHTIRLKENNLRIHAFDTSVGNFPSADWEIAFNSSQEGGPDGIFFNHIDSSTTSTTILQLSPDGFVLADSISANSIRADSIGDSQATVTALIGNFGRIDVAEGADIRGGLRAKGGLTVFDGISISGGLIVEDEDVGMGTNLPIEALHVRRVGADTRILLETDSNNATLRLKASGGRDWVAGLTGIPDEFRITRIGSGVMEMMIEATTGNVTIAGTLTTKASFLPDYVFEEGYPLMPLEDLTDFIEQNGHLPSMPSAAEVQAAGGSIDVSAMQMKLLEKIEELTLYILDEERRLAALEDVLSLRNQ